MSPACETLRVTVISLHDPAVANGATGRPTEAAAPGLAAIRARIDDLDQRIVPLLAARFVLVEAAAAHKRSPDEVAAPERARAVISRAGLLAQAAGGPAQAIEAVYQRMVATGIALEQEAFARSRPAPLATRARPAHDELFGLMRTARAIRRLRPDPVPAHVLDELVRAASWAGTGANRQAFSFVVVTERAQIARLASVWRDASSFYLETLSRKVGAAGAAAHARRLAAIEWQRAHFESTPALIVACYPRPRFVARLLLRPRSTARGFRRLGLLRAGLVAPRLWRWARLATAASIYPAVQNLLLAARARGLGATLTTWHIGLEHELKRTLGIPRRVDVYALVPVGYPLDPHLPVRRRPVEEIRHWERWGGGASAAPRGPA